MLSKALDIRLTAESLGPTLLPFGADDVESTFTRPPVWNDPAQAGTGAVITRSRQSFATVTLRARIGSLRHKVLDGYIFRASLPFFEGEPYTALAPQIGKVIFGRAFPGQPGGMILAASSQEIEFTLHLLDYLEIEGPAPGLAI